VGAQLGHSRSPQAKLTLPTASLDLEGCIKLPESCDNAQVVFYAQVFCRMLGDNDKTSSLLLSCDAPCDVGAESLNNVDNQRWCLGKQSDWVYSNECQ
jgi:hypothetical protein